MILILENPEIKDMINGFLAELEYDYQADRDSPIDVSDEFMKPYPDADMENDGHEKRFYQHRLLNLILADCGLSFINLTVSHVAELNTMCGIFSEVDFSKMKPSSSTIKTLDEYLGDAFMFMLSRINKIAVGPNYETLWIYFKD
jgi:hypothetical protein